MKPKFRAPRNVVVDPFQLARLLLQDSLPKSDPEFERVLGHLRARDVKSLASLGLISDLEYQDQDFNRLLALRQIRTLFSKNEALTDDVRCTKAAEYSFRRAERICRISNKRLDWYGVKEGRQKPFFKKCLSKMQHDIAVLLGDVDTYKAVMNRDVRLTNGATEDRTRKRSHPYMKITGKLRSTRASILYLGGLLRESGVDLSSCRFTAVEQNTVIFVPKNWKTHRSIAKEPTHALPFQLALDSYVKRRIKKWGIDLSSQLRNQELARIGSIDGSLATIDLEMASDTLSYNTVALLLPHDWFRLFEAFRSSKYKAPFESGRYSKFSSMGNGYTFTLETLIFGAACRAVGSQKYSVYGDDIVIETELVGMLVKLLSFLGFKVNKEKSYVNPASRFRESCGSDYFNGRLVTPFYMREVPRLEDFSGMCHLINGLLSATNPGLLWDHLLHWVRVQKLRLVPFNDDTRSGILIHPHTAWRFKRLYVERRPSLKGLPNPDYGFSVFLGYSTRQVSRKTHGWRSLLLWHLRAAANVIAPTHKSKRTSSILLSANSRLLNYTEGENITSSIAIETRFHHAVKRFFPVHNRVPSYVFLLEDFAENYLSTLN